MLEQLRPWIRADGGDVELVDISPDGWVKVRLLGNCKGCGSADVTVDDGIRSALQSQLSWVAGVVLAEAGERDPDHTTPSISRRLEAEQRECEEKLLALDHSIIDLKPGCALPAEVENWCSYAAKSYGRMMEMEELCVFPVLENYLGLAQGPVGVMRREHQRFRELQKSLDAAVDNYRPDAPEALKEAGRAVTRHLTSHLVKERESVFRLLDAGLNDELKMELLQDITRFKATAATAA